MPIDVQSASRVMMEAFQQQPWTLSLRAKAKNLDFKLKLSKILPIFKFSRLSIQFQIHHYVIEIKSKPKSFFSFKPKPLKLKLLRIFKNFQSKRSKNKGIVRSWRSHKNYLYGRRKACIWLRVLLLAMVGCLMIMLLRYYLGKRFVWNCFWRVWNYAATSGVSHQFSQVIFNAIYQPLGF